MSKTRNGLENGLTNGLKVTMPETIIRYVQLLETLLQHKQTSKHVL